MMMGGDKIISEARARIIWGEPGPSVRNFLVTNGISAALADAKLKEFESERSRELRKLGLRNVLTGGILTAAASITLYLWLPIATASSGILKALALVVLAGLYGAWKLLRGVAYLLRPKSEHKSIPDIAQSDLLD